MRHILAIVLLAGCLDPKPEPDDTGGGEPDIAVTPATLDFGEVLQHTSSTASFTLSNLGDGDLSGTLAIQGAGSFVLESGTFTLAPGQTADVTVSFEATDFGSFSDTISVISNDPDESPLIVPISAVVLEDQDGDGYTPEDDCDDADADAYPGNTETWYDGVDGDCAGDDDFDQDADGSPVDEDCDDENANAYPGNDESWYDGVDGDCDNRSDYDQDGDGYDAESEGGDDCDDENEDANPGTLENQTDGFDNDCDGEIDEDLSDADVDGDGYSEIEGDCNDNDIAIYPGAPEGWYDGTDQDCAGDSDYDQDQDGEDATLYGGDDCDDTDSAVNTGGTEVWYDGVDQNCDGLSDNDQDMDGFDVDSSGGADCDDTDANVNPNAAEIWYDGPDQDCDGRSDFDQDMDGHDSDAYSGDDCDDTSADAYPGNTETWYDGADGDCDGLSDYDQDMDGEDSDGHGGPDCDDSDALINTSAEEYCDGLDTDCSGTADDDYALDASTWYADNDLDGYGDVNNVTTACSQPSGYTTDDTDCNDQSSVSYPGGTELAYDALDNDCDGILDEALASDEAIYDISGSSIRDGIAAGLAIGDVDGDGSVDLLIGAPGDDTTDTAAGAVGIFDSSVLGANRDLADAFSLVRGQVASDAFGTSVVILGDADEDSSVEIAIGAPYDDEGGTSTGAVRIIDTRGTHASGSALVTEQAYLLGTDTSGYYGVAMDAGDYDGDGLGDLVVGATGETSSRGRVYVHLADDGYLESSDVSTDSTNIYFRGDVSGEGLGSAVMVHADLSGDAYHDLVACAGAINTATGRCWLVTGSAGQTHANHKIKDYDTAQFSGNAASDGMGSTAGSLAAGDVDGDGQDDLLIGVPGYDGAVTGGGAVAVYFGGTALSGTFTFAQADLVLTGDGALGTGIWSGEDIDGDQADDLLLGAPDAAGNVGAVYLVRGPLLNTTYSLPTEQSASWIGDASGDDLGTFITGFGDIDGDGTSDFAATAPGSDLGRTDGGVVWVLSGY